MGVELMIWNLAGERVRRLTRLAARYLIVCMHGFVLLSFATAAHALDPSGRVLRVVSDENYPPFLFIDPEGRAAGYVADYWQLWSSRTGIAVELEAIRWEDAQHRLLRGEADVIDLIFRTPEREERFDFSAPYADVPASIFSHTSITGIQDVKSLRGFRIGVMAGDACIEMLRREGIDDLRTFDNYSALIASALAEDIKLLCIDEHPANYYLYRQGAQKLFQRAFQLYEGRFHRAVRKHDTETLALIERGAALITPEENAALLEKWLPAPRDEGVGPYLRPLGWGLAVLAGLVLILLVWLGSMRRAVALRTAQLRESEERFRKLFEDTLQPISLMDGDRFVDANPALLKLLGFARLDQLVGRTPAELAPPYQPDGLSSASKAESQIRQASESGSAHFEWTHLTADGTPFIAEICLTRIRHGERDILHAIWSDVTALRAAERELADYRRGLEALVDSRTAELAATNEELEAVFDAALSGIVFVRDRVIVRCNRALERLFGYAPGELTGQSTRLWYPDEASFMTVGGRVLAVQGEDRYFADDIELVRKDGSRVWVRTRSRAIDAKDPSRGVVGVLEDITSERAAAEAVLKAKQLAEDAARVKSDFLANMSHEIRTPMNVIIGTTHLALMAAPDARQCEYLKRIEGSSQHLLRIINDILDLSKIEAGKMTLEASAFALKGLVEDAIGLVSAAAADKGLALAVNVSGDVPEMLRGDRLRLGQVLVNYLSNAVKFTERGEIEIRVDVERRLGEDWLLRFSVRDTGIGLSAAQCSRLFQAFEQADTSTTRRYGGTGLGLAIAKRLAALMGGEVGVDSVLGEGSTFWFTARMGSVAVATALVAPAATSAGLAPDALPVGEQPPSIDDDLAALAGRRILLVEDNPLNQLVATELLRHIGLVVDIAADGAQALDMIERAPYDLVFMDMQMPVMDGLAATEEIRRRPQHAGLPIIAMTANAMDADRARCLAAGMNEHIGKPIEPQRLRAVLRRWLVPPPGDAGPVSTD
ncbi:MAG TPA: hypothetical protein DCL53_10575 [Thauera sp.]|nr:hypothetical protein [Thauera sp.]